MTIAILGGGILGTCTALELADRGYSVTLFERNAELLSEASLYNEGKIHLGFVYAADTTFRTAARMIRGATQFGQILSRWIPTNSLRRMRSRPFDYVVHRDTMVEVAEIERHFAQVEALISEVATDNTTESFRDVNRPVWRRQSSATLAEHYDPELVIAAFDTTEIAIDPWEVATALRSAARLHPRIELRTSTVVHRACPRTDGAFDILCVAGEEMRAGPFRVVLNALWANRPHVDHHVGIVATSAWYTRQKVGVNLLHADVGANVPSSTVMLGPFGDVVVYPSGRVYLSWYPDCMIGVSTGTEPTNWNDVLASIDVDRVTERTLTALLAICPTLSHVRRTTHTTTLVNGGSIFAIGASDIDDPASRLHERLDEGAIGLDRYLSVDTAKYTLGPSTALVTADRIAAIIGSMSSV